MAAGLKEGTRLQGGKYRIERVLGQGSFGITYLASMKMTSSGSLGTMEAEVKVAVKEFFMSEVNSRRPDGSSVEGSSGSVFTNYRKKFRKEAENLAKLSHPNIVKVFDVFDENNTTYYVMDFIEGENLDDYIVRKGKLPESEAIPIVKEVGNAVGYMHARKMLHLDIKPKNVMHKSDGHCYLIDFGLSKQFTDDGEPESSTTIGLGTPGYAPVEQGEYRQDGSFPATLDVYALGATMFKMLTGERPPKATFVLNEGFPAEELVKAGVSEATRSVVEKAMEPKRKNRYQNIASFIGNLKRDEPEVDKDEPTIIEVKPVSREPKPRSRRPEPEPSAPSPDNHSDKNDGNSSRKWIYWGAGIVVVLVASILLWVNLRPNGNDTTANANVKEVTDPGSHEWVDLGLPSGLKWATCNVGASQPWEYGDYFAWGETSPKSEYTEENCKTYNKNIGNISGNPNYDAARANWGGTWRLPTEAECEELQANCSWTRTTNGGKNGYKVVGPNGNSIFLPAAGYRDGTSLNYAGASGDYWSSTPDEDDTQHAYTLDFYGGNRSVAWSYRKYGRSVRPVTE